ncbi:MAG: hypothetical protein AB1403_09980, partial [Candidatus Riflebacteria bacterium]
MVFDVALTYSQNGYELKGFFEPQSSALYAYYPVSGKVEFEKFPAGQLIDTRRMIHAKKFDFEIKDQKRTITPDSGYTIDPPVMLRQSSLWPASSPIQLNTAIPLILTNDDEAPYLVIEGPLRYFTSKWTEPGLKPLDFSCYFSNFKNAALPKSVLGFSFIEHLSPVAVYRSEDILSLTLDPNTEKIVPEGFEAEYKGSLSPLAGYGSGVLSEASTNLGDLDVLEGYKMTTLPGIEWFEDPDWIDNYNWSSNSVAAAFSHIFKPTHGIGSYTLRCRFNFELEESETKDSSKVAIETEVPVSAIPGLRLLSPINRLTYPFDQTIKVTTTMDSQKQWKDITWKLNGKDFDPPGDDPGFPLLLNKTGKWNIEAQLITLDPNTGKPIPLISSATFEVQPLEIAITPEKKVCKLETVTRIPVELAVKAGNNIVEAPGKEFYWADKTKAIVDPVQWSAVSAPENCANLDSDPQSFKAECDFKYAG